MMPIKKVLISLLVFLLIQVNAIAGDSASKQIYPKQNIPLGYGIFEEMHWRQLKNNPDANIQNPYLAGAVFHLSWAALEPSKGVLDTRMLDNLLSIWSEKGKKIILHIKTSPSGHRERNPWKESATPKWVYEAGAQFVESKKKGALQRIPVSWDPIFLKEYQRFLSDLAKRYDGHPGIEFIIVGPGVFGTTRAIYPQMIQKYIDVGYTDEKWFKTIRKIINIYKTTFNDTPLALGVAPFVKPAYVEKPQFNHFSIAREAAQKGLYLYYHNLRGTEKWFESPYPEFFASIGSKTKIVLGFDNPSSGSEKARKKFGDPLTAVQYAFGGLRGLSKINTHYIIFYERDVKAATPGTPRYQEEYEDAMRWGLEEIKKRL